MTLELVNDEPTPPPFVVGDEVAWDDRYRIPGRQGVILRPKGRNSAPVWNGVGGWWYWAGFQLPGGLADVEPPSVYWPLRVLALPEEQP